MIRVRTLTCLLALTVAGPVLADDTKDPRKKVPREPALASIQVERVSCVAGTRDGRSTGLTVYADLRVAGLLGATTTTAVDFRLPNGKWVQAVPDSGRLFVGPNGRLEVVERHTNSKRGVSVWTEALWVPYEVFALPRARTIAWGDGAGWPLTVRVRSVCGKLSSQAEREVILGAAKVPVLQKAIRIKRVKVQHGVVLPKARQDFAGPGARVPRLSSLVGLQIEADALAKQSITVRVGLKQLNGKAVLARQSKRPFRVQATRPTRHAVETWAARLAIPHQELALTSNSKQRLVLSLTVTCGGLTTTCERVVAFRVGERAPATAPPGYTKQKPQGKKRS